MRAVLSFLRLAVWLVGFPGLLHAATIADAVNRVQESSYRNYLDHVLYTQTGDNRGYGPEHDLARQNLFDEFARLGLAPQLDPFVYSGSTYYNVVATQTGATRPNDVYIVGAHYDSVNNPGADDNASGTAGVLETARVLSGFSLDCTLVYIGFDREEQGLRGSYAYAAAHQADQILGMISLDMIAYNHNGSGLARIYGNPGSDGLKNDLAAAVSAYGNGLTPVVGGALNRSDHYSFEVFGFPAVLLIEGAGNPYYHQAVDSVDTPGYIDYTFASNMTRSAVGYLADQAGLVAALPEPGTLALWVLAGVLFPALRVRRGT